MLPGPSPGSAVSSSAALGDGVLIYFGWPKAGEADAEQAVHAALAAAAAAAAPIQGEVLRVRIGIATGLVLVGDRIGTGEAREQAAIGETPNRAARLQRWPSRAAS